MIISDAVAYMEPYCSQRKEPRREIYRYQPLWRLVAPLSIMDASKPGSLVVIDCAGSHCRLGALLR